MKKVRAAVIGVGRLGAEHARVYAASKDAELVAVVDTDACRGGEIASRHDAEFLSDYKLLVGRVDAVSIAVPTDMHYETASFFLKRGVHVLLEKPITETLVQADSLIALGESGGAILQVGHVERFNAALKRAGRDIEEPRFIECHRLASYQPRGTEVSVILDLMIHDIDIILDMVGSEVDKIDAIGVNVLSSDIDIANARISFKNGAVANITSSRVSRDKMRKLRVFAHNRYISVDFLEQSLIMCRKENDDIAIEHISVDKVEPLKLEIEHFLSCIFKEKPPLVSGRPARDALALALRISGIIEKNK